MMSAVLAEAYWRLRPMQDIDLSTIMDIERAAYTFPWTLSIFRDCLRVGYRAWVLEQAGVLVGYGMISMGAGEAHILNLCVHPDWRGRGCGQYILEHALAVAKQHGTDTVFLEVRRSNEAAINLYTQAGFNQVGVRRGYYPDNKGREDALIFALSL